MLAMLSSPLPSPSPNSGSEKFNVYIVNCFSCSNHCYVLMHLAVQALSALPCVVNPTHSIG